MALAAAAGTAQAGPVAEGVAAAPAVRRAVAMAATVAVQPGAARQVEAALLAVVAAVTAPAAPRRLAGHTADEVGQPMTLAPPGGVVPVTTGARPLQPVAGHAGAAA